MNHTIRWFSRPKFDILKLHRSKTQMERESSVECSVFFMWTKEFKAVGYEIVLREIHRCFLHGAAKVFSLYGQENYVLQIVYVGIYVSQTFYKF